MYVLDAILADAIMGLFLRGLLCFLLYAITKSKFFLRTQPILIVLLPFTFLGMAGYGLGMLGSITILTPEIYYWVKKLIIKKTSNKEIKE